MKAFEIMQEYSLERRDVGLLGASGLALYIVSSLKLFLSPSEVAGQC